MLNTILILWFVSVTNSYRTDERSQNIIAAWLRNQTVPTFDMNWIANNTLSQSPTYRYRAPFVAMIPSACSNTATGSNVWHCVATTETDIALALVDPTSNTLPTECDYYCVTTFSATWQVVSETEPEVLISPYLNSPTNCVEVAERFNCKEKAYATYPMNKVSISLYADDYHRNYFFNGSAAATCDHAGVYCSALRVIKNAIYGTNYNIDPTDALHVRGSAFGCLLTYLGSGDVDNVDMCYDQLGPRTTKPGGKSTYVITKDVQQFGITNLGDANPPPMVVCELSYDVYMTAGMYKFFQDVPAGIGRCDVVFVPPKLMTANSMVYDGQMLKTMRGYVTSMSLTLPIMAPEWLSVDPHNIITYLAINVISVAGSGVMLDLSRLIAYNSNLERFIQQSADILRRYNIFSITVKLPLSKEVRQAIQYSQLNHVVSGYILPTDLLQGLNGMAFTCQRWATTDGGESIYNMLTTLSKLIPPQLIIVSLSISGFAYDNNVKPVQFGGAPTPGRMMRADLASSGFQCTTSGSEYCCTGSNFIMQPSADGPVYKDAVTVYTSLDFLRQQINLISTTFGLNKISIADANTDYKVGREALPTVEQLAGIISTLPLLSASAAHTAKSFASSVRQKRDTQSTAELYRTMKVNYFVGPSMLLPCAGLIGVYGVVYIVNRPYVEFHASNVFEGVYVADTRTLVSCTPGVPIKRLVLTKNIPEAGVDINTMLASSKPNHYLVGLDEHDQLVEYLPPVNAVCQDVNTDNIDRMQYVVVDKKVVFSDPTVSEELGVLVIPKGVFHVMSNFTYGVDFINFNSTCIDYDVSALPSCFLTVCGGDRTCLANKRSPCTNSDTILNDARRSGGMMRTAFDQLHVEEQKAMVYEMPDTALTKRKKRFIGMLIAAGAIATSLAMSGAALAIAVQTSNKVNVLDMKITETSNQLIELQGQMVNVTSALDKAIEMTNVRVTELQSELNRRFQVVNTNFEKLKNELRALQTSTSDTFKQMFGFQSWYTQVSSITNQLTQAAMQIQYKALNIQACISQLQSGKMGACPSGIDIFLRHPGISASPTVEALMYKNRKLFIVNRVPNAIETVVMHDVIGLPTISQGVPCWPDYDVWMFNNTFYKPGRCYERYCYEFSIHERFYECLKNTASCRVACAPCYKNVCYNTTTKTYEFDVGTVQMSVVGKAPEHFYRPTIGDAAYNPMLELNITDAEIVDILNTSVVVVDIKSHIKEMQHSLERYKDKMAALDNLQHSGGVTDIVIIVLAVVFLIWLLVLSIMYCKATCNKQVRYEAIPSGKKKTLL